MSSNVEQRQRVRLTKMDKKSAEGKCSPNHLHLNYSDCGWITCNTRIVMAGGKECNEVSGTQIRVCPSPAIANNTQRGRW